MKLIAASLLFTLALNFASAQTAQSVPVTSTDTRPVSNDSPPTPSQAKAPTLSRRTQFSAAKDASKTKKVKLKKASSDPGAVTGTAGQGQVTGGSQGYCMLGKTYPKSGGNCLCANGYHKESDAVVFMCVGNGMTAARCAFSDSQVITGACLCEGSRLWSQTLNGEICVAN